MAGIQDDEVKACCAAAYASDWACHLLGESFHPGGLALTKRLGTLLDLGPGKRLLDVAALMPSCASAPSAPFRTKRLLAESSRACCGLVAAWVWLT